MHTNFLLQPKNHHYTTKIQENREQLKTQINLKISLKTKADLEDAVHNFTTVLQQAAWHKETTSPTGVP
jgi:hypothetical protein